MTVQVYKVHPDAIIPRRQTEGAAGYDLHALEEFEIAPGQRVHVRTGLVIRPPEGYHTEILPRSGNAFKYGVMLTNNVGLIDRDFAGQTDEIMVMLYRVPGMYRVPGRPPDVAPTHFNKGDRIAQLVIRKTEVMELVEVSRPPLEIARGGLGSTGLE